MFLPLKTPHQHRGMECKVLLVLHSITVHVVQSAHAVCSEQGCSKAGQYMAWMKPARTSQIQFMFHCYLISGFVCSETFYFLFFYLVSHSFLFYIPTIVFPSAFPPVSSPASLLHLPPTHSSSVSIQTG